jgi:hypothetical protein
MILRISVMCPLCNDDVVWLYDTEANEQNRRVRGCSRCTSVLRLNVRQISEDRAKIFLENQLHPHSKLESLTDED